MADHVVTGAYGYSGRAIARRLLGLGHTVRTLTDSPQRANPFGREVTASRFFFDQPDRLAESLRGVDVLYNTYWVRFNHRDFNHDTAVRNSTILFRAAAAAGVRRIVHVSITNPSLDSDLEYFRGKAEVELALASSGTSHTILRPAVLFGGADILVNNIVWALRRLPVFGVFGDGHYRLQPIHVDDLAELAIREAESSGDVVIDAVGPETFTYRQLVTTLGAITGATRPVVSLPPRLAYLLTAAIGRLVGDVVLTWPEIQGLMRGLLATSSDPAGSTRLTTWATRHRDEIGRRYANELRRRRDRELDYAGEAGAG